MTELIEIKCRKTGKYKIFHPPGEDDDIEYVMMDGRHVIFNGVISVKCTNWVSVNGVLVINL